MTQEEQTKNEKEIRILIERASALFRMQHEVVPVYKAANIMEHFNQLLLTIR